ncbi:MAG: sigma-54 dependent transcriptional regulator [Bacteroidetes bacterium]|jgi:two-component system, NtrC family, nitrogen regulation response regulator NtrX|nr:sigma-54 dependent transcriptional regulator [Bacteroidota bacterium]MDA0880065.1 sigma-54 dependent transcriptional regulator [Bacteroidota bacterium]MDA1115973.1 sigma-54 dependent transcriptional regulator [Bacteroidota bacterium]
MPKILVIEDEEAIRRVLKKILTEQDAAYDVYVAANGIDGLHEIEKQQFDLVLCDIKMPKMDGIEVLQNIKSRQPDLPVIMISGHGDLETAVGTMRMGAFDYISKPPDLNRLMTTISHALSRKTLEQENKVLKRKIGNAYEMIGESPAIKTIKEIIDKVAATSARVLITGPNGTGKELVAHWIHQKSERVQGPMIEVNCAAIPSELIESELFGHVKGAFTSAVKDRAGKFEAAHGGTLFLDEIGDMSLSAQAKVLRALQENLIQRVGSDKSIKVDVRVIAATNKNLKEEIAEGRFREDLFHRIAVILIQVPPLNDRREDIPMLVKYFVEQISSAQGSVMKSFTAEAIDCLKNYDWTGNIRELRNVVERLLILGGSEISKKDVLQFANKL